MSLIIMETLKGQDNDKILDQYQKYFCCYRSAQPDKQVSTTWRNCKWAYQIFHLKQIKTNGSRCRFHSNLRKVYNLQMFKYLLVLLSWK